MIKQIDKDAEEADTGPFVDLKHVVWHDSFKKLLESICIHSKTGCFVKCGNKMEQCLFPCMLILLADYEEQ